MEHINQFRTEALKFFKGAPVKVVPKFYSQDGHDRASFSYRVDKEIPERLGIIAGECIHNLRSILDNLIWGLCERFQTPNTIHDHIAFPICLTCAKDYHAKLSTPQFMGIQNFPPDVQTLIASLQPYNGPYTNFPQGNQVYILDRLWNDDKHRVPALMLATSNMVDMKGWQLKQPASISVGGTVKDGAVFADGGVPKIRPEPNQYPVVSVDITFDVRGAALGTSAIFLMTGLHNFVRDKVITPLEPIFSGNP
jgi:hypothetical protein